MHAAQAGRRFLAEQIIDFRHWRARYIIVQLFHLSERCAFPRAKCLDLADT